jgi:succinoglycan biosynthesis protein ExoL
LLQLESDVMLVDRSATGARRTGMNIAYFVHNLNDPAVHRRVRMLHTGGATVTLIGFFRGDRPTQVEGCTPIVLGRTHDARLVQRLVATARAGLGIGRHRRLLAGADVMMARQLEMLAVASRARRLFAPAATLVYECLDIHRLMIASGAVGWAMRRVEERLLGKCQLLVVSSAGFLREYFAKFHDRMPPVLVLENKMLSQEIADAPAMRALARPPGPPWRIGWFGNIRCSKSLAILSELTQLLPGRVEVVIRGRPAYTAVPDFDKTVSAHPGIAFLGPYDRSRDLPRIYGEVHFTWAIDFFEAGGNSDWLLPNRIYEGSLFGAVALALASVETGRWLADHGVGVLASEPFVPSLARYFGELDEAGYLAARAAVDRLPLGALMDDSSDCERLVQALGRPRGLERVDA